MPGLVLIVLTGATFIQFIWALVVFSLLFLSRGIGGADKIGLPIMSFIAGPWAILSASVLALTYIRLSKKKNVPFITFGFIGFLVALL